MLRQLFRDCQWWLQAQYSVRLWNGQLPLPHALKQAVVRGYLRDRNIHTFIETGTYRGDMAAAMRRRCDEVHTIELDPTLAAKAQGRFRYWRKVRVYQGDSALVLPSILNQLSRPALLWLDAHYSGGATARGSTDTPLAYELEQALPHAYVDTVLIDDARHLGTSDYPTLERIHAIASEAGRDVRVEMDIVRIT